MLQENLARYVNGPWNIVYFNVSSHWTSRQIEFLRISYYFEDPSEPPWPVYFSWNQKNIFAETKMIKVEKKCRSDLDFGKLLLTIFPPIDVTFVERDRKRTKMFCYFESLDVPLKVFLFLFSFYKSRCS